MSSINLDDLIVKFPKDYDTIQRLSQFINENSGKSEFALQRLYDLALPSTTFVFIQLLNCLLEAGILKKIVRIESPSMGGIEDYSSIIDVPEKIYDWRQDMTITVKPENIRILYQIVKF